jgi:hypothetical protein
MRRHDQRVSRLKATTAVATYSRDAPPLASQVSAVPAPASLGGAASFSSDLIWPTPRFLPIWFLSFPIMPSIHS